MSRGPRTMLAAGLLLALIVIAGIVAVSQVRLNGEIEHVLMLALGMFSTAALLVIFRAAESAGNVPMISITFNEASASERIRTIDADVIDTEVIDKELQAQEKEGGQISAAALVGRDNNLALAKLRMDLEQAVQVLAKQFGIEQASYSPRRLFDSLVEREHLPIELASVWREVFSATTKAIHGASVDDETAESIVRVGIQLLSAFRKSAEKRMQQTSHPL